MSVNIYKNGELKRIAGNSGGSSEGGRSIKSIRLDNENNIWVKYNDGSPEENVGQLNVNVEADFLTVSGFGKLRYYQNQFQYYNEETQDWIDTVVTPDNIYVVNMTPLPMKSIVGRYDYNIGHYKLKWAEPSDTVIDGQVMCVVDKVIIRRKQNSVPTDINDGTLVVEIPRRQFGTYKTKWFVDESFKPNLGDTYYYKAFPVSATTQIYSNSPMNEVIFTADKTRDYELYGFEIDQNESAPEYMIKYIEDNIGWNPAHMNYDTDLFDYGDWTPENAFFMNVRPCMLRYDGTVAYYLNPDNYYYKENGEPSDVANEDFDGNAMAQFPKIYWKITDLGNNRGQVLISNKNVDGTYHCWSHIDANGDEIPYCYMPMYNGSLDSNNIVRSLSGQNTIKSKSQQEVLPYAFANNKNKDNIWCTEIFSDRQLVNLLLTLIGKSTDTQSIFGYGNCFVGSPDGEHMLITGTMDTKGMFYGKNTETIDGVKVFHMENWWGNQNHRILGWVLDNGVQKVKMVYGKQDGSEIIGYNLKGEGYIVIPNSTMSGVSGTAISKMIFSDKGLFPKVLSGSTSTYYTDRGGYVNSGITHAGLGGNVNINYLAGAFFSIISNTIDSANVVDNYSISCKPLLTTQQGDPNVNMEVA